MKKNLSVLGLFARSTFYPFLCLMGLLTLTDVGVFAWNARKWVLLERTLSRSHLQIPFAVVFLLLVVCLCLTGCEFSGKQGYTLRRLGVTEYRVFLWQSVYNCACFLLLWAWQTVVVYILCRLHTNFAPEEAKNSQTLMLAFYRTDFLHNLLPLRDVSRWIRNVFLVVLLGFGCAYFPLKQRKGSFPILPVLAVLLSVFAFTYGVSTFTVNLVVMLIGLFLLGCLLMYSGEAVKVRDE